MSMPSAQAREPQARPRRVLISFHFVSLELTAALGRTFALEPDPLGRRLCLLLEPRARTCFLCVIYSL